MSKPFLHVPRAIINPELTTDPHARFLQLTADMAYGISRALELIHSSHGDRSDGGRFDGRVPILSETDTDLMMRFAIASSSLLGDRAFDEIEWANRPAFQEQTT